LEAEPVLRRADWIVPDEIKDLVKENGGSSLVVEGHGEGIGIRAESKIKVVWDSDV
jgi:hypothetical protein